MNVLFLSPHFPPNYYLFCAHLKRLGANVFGVGDAAYEHLSSEVKDALTGYYRVDTLDDHEQALRAAAYFVERYGKIDCVASHNEHWLELEARIREAFDVPGKKLAETAKVRSKALMKRAFAEAHIEVAAGRPVHTLDDAQALVRETGYPVIAKPDRGVGASGTYRLVTDDELRRFFAEKTPVDYFMEAFVAGRIVTFDGLVDAEGNIVFFMSLEYSRNIMEVVAEDDHVYYYTLRALPADLVAAGTASVRAFDLRNQFFHFEFFRTPDGQLLGLEINARPPGWPTTDMFNYANDADAYREWANIVNRRAPEYEWKRKYHCIYVGRKDRVRYRHGDDEIMRCYGGCVIDRLRLPPIFSRAMGNAAYIARSADLDALLALAAFAHETDG